MMRKLLATAVALGPLCMAQAVVAETTISNERTTPVVTSVEGDNVKITNTGSVKIASGTGVTINSDHNLTNEGGIRLDASADNSVGVAVTGVRTANISNSGQISVTGTVTNTDTDNDGDFDTPFASGTGRHGLWVQAGSTLIGDITNLKAGGITVIGNDSYGVRLEGDLQGDFLNRGSITVTGDNSYGYRNTGSVTGDVTLGGGIAVKGEGSVAASVEGDISGRLTIDGTITATGFRETNRRTIDADRALLDADDLLIGGPAIVIAADVGGGVLFDRAAPNDDASDPDEDNDGIPDAEETTATIVQFGSEPAVRIGSTTDTVTLGVVGAGDLNYGIVFKGEIITGGVNDGVSSVGMEIGLPGGQAVTVTNGLINSGGIRATAYEADATAIRIGSAASVPAIVNSGVISAEYQSKTAGTEAIALDVSGTSLTTITNSGVIRANRLGTDGDTTAILDRDGSITSLSNTGRISATVEGGTGGTATAMNFAANVTGVTVTQTGVNDGDDGGDGAADPDADGDGVDDADEPLIRGAVLFGSGADVLDLQNGELLGDVSFGAGLDTLTITGGALLRGALSDADGQLDITVADGVLEASHTAPINITNLTVGADGDLLVTIDPEAATATGFVVSGTADFANGAGLGVRFASLLQAPTQYVIVDAATLNVGTLDVTALEENTPYFYIATAGTNANEIFVDVRRRTADEAGFIASEAGMYDAFYSALEGDLAMRDAFLAQVGRENFMSLYEQVLPDHSGQTLLTLASGVDAVTRALSDRRPVSRQGETTAWLQEINYYADKERDTAYGFRADGFGVAGGIERGTSRGAFGMSLAFTSGDSQDPEAEAEEVLTAQLLEFGVYWRYSGENWRGWVRGAAGYAMFDSTREFVGAGLFRQAESDWSGYTVAAGAGVSHESRFGSRYYVRPELTVDYFMLSEDERVETGGGDGFNLAVESREGYLLTSSAVINVGGRFGDQGWLRPEARIGWRHYLAYDPGETIARFAATGGSPFMLEADSLEGGGPIIGFRLTAGGALGFLALEGDAELIDGWQRMTLMIRAAFRF